MVIYRSWRLDQHVHTRVKRKSSRGFLSGHAGLWLSTSFTVAAAQATILNLDMPTTTQTQQLQAIAATAKDAQDLLSSYMQLKQTVNSLDWGKEGHAARWICSHHQHTYVRDI